MTRHGLLLLALVLAPACASTSKQTSWLFVQNAGRAELGGGKLVLHDVPPTVVCFTDRPQRRAGTVPTEHFLRGWDEGGVFENDPPNATLAVFLDGKVHEAVVELTNPRGRGGEVTYDVKVLEGSAGVQGPAALFIDSVGSNTPVVRHGMHDEPGVILRRGMHFVR